MTRIWHGDEGCGDKPADDDGRSIRVTTGPYRLGDPDQIVVVIDEAADLLRLDRGEAREIIAGLMRDARRP